MNMSLTLPGFTQTSQAQFLAALLGGVILVIFGLSLRQTLLWRLALRNLLRHRGQVLVIIAGLTVFSMVLIVSLGLPDSLTHSLQIDRLSKVGTVDEAVTGPFSQQELTEKLMTIRQHSGVKAATALYLNPLGASLHVLRTGIHQDNQYLLALPPDFDQVYGALTDAQGQAVSIARPGANEVLLSQSVARTLDVRVGDQLQIALSTQQHANAVQLTATVRAILVNDPTITDGELAWDGSYAEILLPLAALQQALAQAAAPAVVPNTICITNVSSSASQEIISFLEQLYQTTADTRAPVPTDFTQTLIHPLQPGMVEDNSWSPLASKGDFITSAAARQFLFLQPALMCLLLAAGLILLVVLILGLAEERRVELGIARAIGLSRFQLILTLVLESGCIGLLAALPGLLLGLGALELVLLTLAQLPALSFVSASTIPLHLWLSWQSGLSVFCLGLLAIFIITCCCAVWISQGSLVHALYPSNERPPSPSLPTLLRQLRSAQTISRWCLIRLRLLLALVGRGPLCLLIGGLLYWQGQILSLDLLTSLALFVLLGGLGLLLIWLCSLVHLPDAFSRWLGGSMIGVAWLVYGLQTGSATLLFLFTTSTDRIESLDLNLLFPHALISLLLPFCGLLVLVITNSDSLATVIQLITQRVRSLSPIGRASLAYPLTYRLRTSATVALLGGVLFLIALILTSSLTLGHQVSNASDATSALRATTANAYGIGMTQFFVIYLLIGIAFGLLSLGVLASRAVIERQQDIGMLRALGFSRALVRRSFFLETSFLVTLSLVISLGLAWWLVEHIAQESTQPFQLPVLLTLALVPSCFLVSWLCTAVPAQQAARLLPAEALRYE